MAMVTTMPLQKESARSPDGDQTYWEVRASTRWGSYITAIERDALLAAHATFARPGRGLEVGCEGGRWCRLLADRGWQMTGLDIDPEMVRLCKRRHPTVRCVLVGADDCQFPIESSTIDLLVCIEVAVVDHPWFASEAARVLKPGGKLVGVALNANSWRGVAANVKSTIIGRQWYYVQSYTAFQKSLLEHGLRIETARGCCWWPFGRQSNSRFVLLAIRIERALRLEKLTRISPWVIYIATRR